MFSFYAHFNRAYEERVNVTELIKFKGKRMFVCMYVCIAIFNQIYMHIESHYRLKKNIFEGTKVTRLLKILISLSVDYPPNKL